MSIQANIDGHTFTGRGAHTDVVRASAEAFLHAVNKAAAAARRLDGAPGSGDVRYDLACSYSRLAESHPDGAVGVLKRDADLSRSLEALQGAISAWESEEQAVDWGHIKNDRDLNALRETAGYKQLARGR